MISVFVFFILVVALFLLPSQIFTQSNKLKEVEESLTVRLKQLKQDFQFRTKELNRRLASGDLAQQEWQQLSDELLLDTNASIESTQFATDNSQSELSRVTGGMILLFISIIGILGYYFSDSRVPAQRQYQIEQRLKTEPQLIEQLSQQAEKNNDQYSMEQLFLALREKVELQPNDIDTWRALSLFNARIGRTDEALNSIKTAIANSPENIDLKVELAQLYTSAEDKETVQKGYQLLANIIRLHPDHEGARLLFGFSSFSLGLYQSAIDAWTSILNKRDQDSASSKMLQKSIEVARQRLSQGGIKDGTAQSLSGEIAITIEIPPQIRKNYTGKETLFVFAKAIDGPKFPVAVVKYQLDSAPETIVLSDADAMQPGVKISNFSQIQITARVTRTGDVTNKEGALEGNSGILSAPYTNVAITLDEQK